MSFVTAWPATANPTACAVSAMSYCAITATPRWSNNGGSERHRSQRSGIQASGRRSSKSLTVPIRSRRVRIKRLQKAVSVSPLGAILRWLRLSVMRASATSAAGMTGAAPRASIRKTCQPSPLLCEDSLRWPTFPPKTPRSSSLRSGLSLLLKKPIPSFAARMDTTNLS